MGFNVALDESDALFRVNAAGKHQSVSREGIFLEGLRVLTDGDCMLVYDTVSAVIFVLQFTPVFDCSEVVAEGEGTAGWLDTGEDDRFTFWFWGSIWICVFHDCDLLIVSKRIKVFVNG